MLCDTVGHATPNGAYNLVKFAVDEVVKPSGEKIRVDWHGHNDRGLAVANSLAAIAGGADQVHAAANSLGERVGNTPMELMLVNLRLMGLISQDLSRLKEYCEQSGHGHAYLDPGQLSGGGTGRVSHRDGSTRGGDHQSVSQKRRGAGRCGLQRSARASVRAGAGDRNWADERKVKRALLAGEAREFGGMKCGQSNF